MILLCLARSWFVEFWLGSLLLVGRLGVGSVVASAGGGELEGLDGEGEVLVIGVIDQEPVVDVLLETLGLITRGHQGAAVPGGGALLDPGGLAQGLVVSLDSVDDDPPLAVGVDGALGLDVRSDGGAEVSLLDNLLQPVHAVLSVGEHVLVDGLDALVVVLEGVLNLVGGVLGVLEAPGLGVIDGALGGSVGLSVVNGLGVVGGGLMVGSGLVIGSRLVIGCRLVVGGGLIGRGGRVVGGGGVVDHGLMVGGGLMIGVSVMDHGGLIHSLGGVHGGGVVHGLHGAVGGGGGVAISAGVDYGGGVVNGVNCGGGMVNSAVSHVTSHVDGGISVSLGLCTNSESHRSQ